MALTIPNTFVNGTPAIATEVNSNFTAVKTEVDLKIDSTIVDAKGDLIVATAADTVARQAVGSNGQVLIADSGVANGVAWVDPQTNRNVIINGAMQVAQRGTSTAGITSIGYYTADRWNFDNVGLGTWTMSVENDAPTGSGFRKSAKVLCTTADASPASTDYLALRHRMEGQNLQQFLKGTASAKQFALSFWVKSNVTGTYVVGLEDVDNNRILGLTYSISASATWEKKTIIFPADTTGALDNDNAQSLLLNFWLAVGSNLNSSTLQTTWGTANFSNGTVAVGQLNLAAATNNYWQITGVQLEAGAVATPFEFEDIGTTLRKCQRYFETQDWSGNTFRVAVAYGDTTTANLYFMYETKRAIPSFSWSTNGSARYVYQNGQIGVSQTLSTSVSSVNGTSASTSGTFPWSTGWIDSGGTLSISAEL
jgi:hypothetical protein